MNQVRQFLFILMFLFFASKGLTQELHIRSYKSILERMSANPDTLYVLNFWATWCKPCITELPEFEGIAAKRMPKTVVMLYSLDFKSKLSSQVIPFLGDDYQNVELYIGEKELGDEGINAISNKWSGAIPFTIIKFRGKAFEYEKMFDQGELEKEINNIRNTYE